MSLELDGEVRLDLDPSGIICTTQYRFQPKEAGDVLPSREQPSHRTSGLRVLLVEDEIMVALLLEEMLAELGHTVVGPVTRLERDRLNPPDRALVLCCDEKSQCQALERRQLGLRWHPSPRTMPHDYVRHGTITLFASLEQITGKLITRPEARHTHVEWLRFLKQIDRETPRDLGLHLIADNYATHQHPRVPAWLARHRRFTMHFTPTSSSWLNLVERFFVDLTGDVIRSGSFTSVNQLIRDINAYLARRNADPKPSVWRAEGAAILAKSNVLAPLWTASPQHELWHDNSVSGH